MEHAPARPLLRHLHHLLLQQEGKAQGLPDHSHLLLRGEAVKNWPPVSVKILLWSLSESNSCKRLLLQLPTPFIPVLFKPAHPPWSEKKKPCREKRYCPFLLRAIGVSPFLPPFRAVRDVDLGCRPQNQGEEEEGGDGGGKENRAKQKVRCLPATATCTDRYASSSVPLPLLFCFAQPKEKIQSQD